MSLDNERAAENIIVFDNLCRATDTIGDVESIKAKTPEAFHNTNAAGSLPDKGSLDDIFELGATAGASFKASFA